MERDLTRIRKQNTNIMYTTKCIKHIVFNFDTFLRLFCISGDKVVDVISLNISVDSIQLFVCFLLINLKHSWRIYYNNIYPRQSTALCIQYMGKLYGSHELPKPLQLIIFPVNSRSMYIPIFLILCLIRCRHYGLWQL